MCAEGSSSAETEARELIAVIEVFWNWWYSSQRRIEEDISCNISKQKKPLLCNKIDKSSIYSARLLFSSRFSGLGHETSTLDSSCVLGISSYLAKQTLCLHLTSLVRTEALVLLLRSCKTIYWKEMRHQIIQRNKFV